MPKTLETTDQVYQICEHRIVHSISFIILLMCTGNEVIISILFLMLIIYILSCFLLLFLARILLILLMYFRAIFFCADFLYYFSVYNFINCYSNSYNFFSSAYEFNLHFFLQVPKLKFQIINFRSLFCTTYAFSTINIFLILLLLYLTYFDKFSFCSFRLK